MKPPIEKAVTCFKIFRYITVGTGIRLGWSEGESSTMWKIPNRGSQVFSLFPANGKIDVYISRNSDLSMP